ncbi:MAG: hypothetical protein CL920_21870 [Deltaproteobacteria bacterium]|nr:hypothetical protein [Deltaproteobacteria bacterium]MBU51346.1 hypothetical protein [Deltaproteobacteria bacterium]
MKKTKLLYNRINNHRQEAYVGEQLTQHFGSSTLTKMFESELLCEQTGRTGGLMIAGWMCVSIQNNGRSL